MSQIEEFSGPDMRHTLGEAWRVVSQRRAWLGASFAALASLALLASHWIPRKYTGATLFERRNDMVLQSVIGPTWDRTYEAQRHSLVFDLTGPAALAEALERTEVGRALPRDAAARLTPEGETARDLILQKLPDELEVKMIESTPQRDVVEVRVTDGEPQLAAQLVVAIRESYVERSKAKLRGLLVESLDYFHREARQTAEQARLTERQIGEMEKSFSGLGAESVTASAAEFNSLTLERTDLQRRLPELKAAAQAASEQCRHETEGTRDATPPAMKDNPRRPELAAEMRKLEQMITDEKVLRGKTDEHPTVAALRDKWERLRESYRAEPERVLASAQPDGPGSASTREPPSLAAAMDAAQHRFQDAETRLAAVQQRLNELDGLRTAATDKRPEYKALKETLARRQTEMADWQTHIDPIQRMLSAQGRERGVQFISFREPGTITRPTSPDARAVLLVCLAVGLGGAVLTVVLLEFSDRSFRTAVQVTKSLTLPVLEAIEEIITPALQRRRLVQKLVVTPLALVLLVALLLGSAGAAYMSLESHDSFERLKHDPLHPLRALRAAANSSAASATRPSEAAATRPPDADASVIAASDAPWGG